MRNYAFCRNHLYHHRLSQPDRTLCNYRFLSLFLHRRNTIYDLSFFGIHGRSEPSACKYVGTFWRLCARLLGRAIARSLGGICYEGQSV